MLRAFKTSTVLIVSAIWHHMVPVCVCLLCIHVGEQNKKFVIPRAPRLRHRPSVRFAEGYLGRVCVPPL